MFTDSDKISSMDADKIINEIRIGLRGRGCRFFYLDQMGKLQKKHKAI